ncbi:hypothetical protein [Microbacterium trichothecenolyticum]|uniref:Uncharacterized protein n=1 Tax=Microbacterium trichothecenolyticum TaxID=69370 RepID=A0ABU0TYJ8_MICTR|nr:hypothetical protein [Microbacterium trichothecenolyticum]MDQ1124731.1 hypothetical protein [Microbacterium trichothecenolyticum]
MTRTLAALPGAARRLCLSRRNGEICTRETGHRGLHHRRGGRLLWSDLQADPPQCPGVGAPAQPAATLPDGYPGGRALCPVCWAFVIPVDGALAPHDTWRGDDSRAEADRRRDWFNAFGW